MTTAEFEDPMVTVPKGSGGSAVCSACPRYVPGVSSSSLPVTQALCSWLGLLTWPLLLSVCVLGGVSRAGQAS